MTNGALVHTKEFVDLMISSVCVIRPQALALAMAYQSVTNHHKQRPPIDLLGPNDNIHT